MSDNARSESPAASQAAEHDPFAGGFPAVTNVTARLDALAAERGDQLALRVQPARPSGPWHEVRFDALAERVRRLSSGLLAEGLNPGDRVSVFVKPGPDLVAVVYALLRAGLQPVLVDPGLGRRNLLECVRRSAPKAFIGIPAAQVIRRLFPKAFASIERSYTVGGRFGGTPLADVEARGDGDALPIPTAPEDPAALLFTSGSTGPPKGVQYLHRTFEAQVRVLQHSYGFEPGEVDAACFPPFALFDACLGMTSVIPHLDPTRMAKCDPARVVAAIEEGGATTSFGSPAVWRRVVPWCEQRGRRLEGLRRVLIAGAPVPLSMVERLAALLPNGAVYTPYGATESLPVAKVSSADLLAEDVRAATLAGSGTCVGRSAPGIDWCVLPVSDGPLERLDPHAGLGPGRVGELAVAGPQVTEEYADLPEPTLRAKARDGRGRVWHRMGDLVQADDAGRLWFQGRASHRIRGAAGDIACVPAENVVLARTDVERAALVALGEPGRQTPVLVLELDRARVKRDGRRLREAALGALELAGLPVTLDGRRVPVEHVLFHPRFPVDVRHNSKIHRTELSAWATARLQG